MPELKFTLSHSAVNSYRTCPALYAATYISNAVPFETNKYSQLGSAVHKLAEWYVKDKHGMACYQAGIALEPLAAQYVKAAMKSADAHKVDGDDVMAHWERLHIKLDCLFSRLPPLSAEQVHVEVPWAMQLSASGLVPANYGAKDAIRRGKIDLALIVDTLAYCIDYKTGSTIKDDGQLQQNALLLLANNPKVNVVVCMSLSTQGVDTLVKVVHRRGIPQTEGVDEVLGGILHINDTIRHAYATNDFPATPNGLCRRFCGNKQCRYNGGGK